MAIIRIIRPPMVTAEVYDGVNAKAGVNENPPEGLLMHTAGEVDGQWQIVDVWESEEHADRFGSERLSAGGESVPGGRPPRSSTDHHLRAAPRDLPLRARAGAARTRRVRRASLGPCDQIFS